MGETTLERARGGDERAFQELVEPFRRELQVHCYRMLGSVADAEDAVQETMMAAWRGIRGFEGRSTFRSWLYRIATNRSLNALRAASRRPRSADALRGAPAGPTGRVEPTWLEPFPDMFLEGVPDDAPGPEARIEQADSVKLAFVAALQRLSPLQRAVLVLRDVLGYRAAEVAEQLETSESAVNSALKRARAAIRADHDVRDLATDDQFEVADRFARGLQDGDLDSVIELLGDDVRLTMPPDPAIYRGRAAVAGFLRERCTGAGIRLVPTRANGQPAFGWYVRDRRSAIAHAHGLVVLTIADSRVSAMTRFFDSSTYPYFGLPKNLPE